MSTDWVGDQGRQPPLEKARGSDGGRLTMPRTKSSMLPSITWRFVVAVVGVGTTIAVSLFASSATGPTPVAISGWAGPSYAKDVTGFHPLADQLVADLSPPAKAAHAVQSSAPSNAALPPTATGDTQGGPTPSPSTSPPDVVTPTPTPAPLQPSLSIEISADQTKTHPNSTIVYTIRVANAGPGSAQDLVIQSHVPDGTTLAGWTCNGATVQADGRDSFACGTASATPTHPVVFGVSSLGSGAQILERFWVTVNHDVRRHTDLTNHAHVYARDVDPVDSEPASVLIP